MATSLQNVRLDELSLCHKGANRGARVVLFKRDFTQAERDSAASSGAALPDGSFPIHTTADLKNAIHAIGRAKDPAKAKAHIKSRAASLGATSMLPDEWKKSDQPVTLDKALLAMAKAEENDGALSEASEAIAERDELSDVGAFFETMHRAVNKAISDDEPDVIEASVAKFTKAIREQFPDAEVELTQLLKSNSATAGFFSVASNTEESMTEAEKKAHDELTKSVETLTKKIAELEKSGMSADHKAFMAQMPEEKRGDFSAMSPSDREDYMSKNPVKKAEEHKVKITVGDKVIKIKNGAAEEEKPEAVTFAGETFAKAGDPHFPLAKRMVEIVEKQAERIAKLEDDATDAEVRSMIEKKYPRVPGEMEAKVRLYKSTKPDDRKTLEAQWTAIDKMMATDALKEIGGGGPGIASGGALEQIETLAKARAAEKKISIEKARDDVITENSKLYLQSEQERRQHAMKQGVTEGF